MASLCKKIRLVRPLDYFIYDKKKAMVAFKKVLMATPILKSTSNLDLLNFMKVIGCLKDLVMT